MADLLCLKLFITIQVNLSFIILFIFGKFFKELNFEIGHFSYCTSRDWYRVRKIKKNKV